MVKTHRITADSLHASLAPLQASGTVYLLGELSATGVAAMPPTVEVNSESVQLHYASPEILRGWGKKQLVDVDMTIQIRHDPDSQVAEIGTFAPVSKIGLDPLLQKWIDVTAE
jgi:hypothetical protein